MITVRSIITEALSRSNLVSRRQSAPADMVETAFRLLKGIAGKFSNDNLLQFLVCDVTADLDKQEYVLGETDTEAPEEYREVDIEAPKIQKVNKAFWRSRNDEYTSFVEMNYASPEEFDAYPVGTSVYTYQPINDLQGVFKTKLLPSSTMEIKISYNKKWTIDLDGELRIPEQYTELFITALTHKLALTHPRLSTEQVKLLKEDLDEMINNVKTATRAIKYVSRKPQIPAVSRADFISGRMFLGG